MDAEGLGSHWLAKLLIKQWLGDLIRSPTSYVPVAIRIFKQWLMMNHAEKNDDVSNALILRIGCLSTCE